MQQETKVRKSKKADKQAKILLEDKNPHTAIKLPLYLIPADETNGNSKRRISVQDAAAEISNESYNYNKADVTVIEDSEKPKKSKKAKVGKKSKESDDADQSGKCLASKIAIKDVGLDIVDRDDEIKLQTETSKEGEFKIKKKKEKKIKVNEVKIQAIEQEVKKSGISLLLFYAYISPEWTSAQYTEAQTWATETASSFNITGRLRVAKEGFNGTMTGDYDGIRSWCNSIREWNPAFFGNTDFKITDLLPEGQRFPELKVFGVKELVNYGLEGKQPDLIHGGTHLAPKDFHEKMRNDNTLIIDVRNFYEAEIGHFTPPEGGAKYIDPQMRVSTEFPQWVKDNAGELAGKDIMMFCTGGIRCERASALVKEYVEEVGNVFQLQGGIHRYLEEYSEDGGFWKGHNYTFDKRFCHGAKTSEVMGACRGCSAPHNKFRGKKRCLGCGVPLLICDKCQNKKLELSVVCLLCDQQGVKAKTKKSKPQRGDSPSCGVCKETFKSRNALFKHLGETGHMDRKRK